MIAMLESIVASGSWLYDDEVECLKEVQKEIAVTDKLLDARNETLALIPECPIHGPQCQPHMREWIEKAKAAVVEVAT